MASWIFFLIIKKSGTQSPSTQDIHKQQARQFWTSIFYNVSCMQQLNLLLDSIAVPLFTNPNLQWDEQACLDFVHSGTFSKFTSYALQDFQMFFSLIESGQKWLPATISGGGRGWGQFCQCQDFEVVHSSPTISVELCVFDTFPFCFTEMLGIVL